MELSAKILEGENILIIKADEEAKKELIKIYQQADGGYFKAESFVGEGLMQEFHFLLPEQIGALTDSPILVNADGYEQDEEGEIRLLDNARVFFFNLYAIRDPWKILGETGRIILNEAPAWEEDFMHNKIVQVPVPSQIVDFNKPAQKTEELTVVAKKKAKP